MSHQFILEIQINLNLNFFKKKNPKQTNPKLDKFVSSAFKLDLVGVDFCEKPNRTQEFTHILK